MWSVHLFFFSKHEKIVLYKEYILLYRGHSKDINFLILIFKHLQALLKNKTQVL